MKKKNFNSTIHNVGIFIFACLTYFESPCTSKCHLGDLAYDTSGASETDINTVRIRKVNAKSHFDTDYTERFNLKDTIWTKHAYEEIPLITGQDYVECGVKCEMYPDNCQYFALNGGKCYMMKYEINPNPTINAGGDAYTYHKPGKAHLS